MSKNSPYSYLFADIGYIVLYCKAHQWIRTLKPIFHQNAKYLASGTFASPNARNSTSASPNARIPTCWYILRLYDANFLRRPQRQTPTPASGIYVALGLLALAMYISCCLCTIFHVGNAKNSRRKGRFQWNTGLKIAFENLYIKFVNNNVS